MGVVNVSLNTSLAQTNLICQAPSRKVTQEKPFYRFAISMHMNQIIYLYTNEGASEHKHAVDPREAYDKKKLRCAKTLQKHCAWLPRGELNPVPLTREAKSRD